MRCAKRSHHVIGAPTAICASSVLGVASLLIWALILIVTIKYVILLMRADNKGEGGILSLVVLVETGAQAQGRASSSSSASSARPSSSAMR